MKIYFLQTIYSSVFGHLSHPHDVLESFSIHRSRIDGIIEKKGAKPIPDRPDHFERTNNETKEYVVFRIASREVNESETFTEPQ